MKTSWLPTLLIASLCTGCATRPMIPPPKVSSTAGQQRPLMAAAYSKADSLRTAFYDKGTELVNAQIDLNNGLLGLGIAALGLAVGKVHKDSFTAVAFGAAGAYSFGQLGISKPRQVVYFQGLSAVNCALKAVSPLDISPDSLAALQRHRPMLDGAITRLVDAMARLQAQGGGDNPVTAPARASLLGAQQVLAELADLPERADKAARDLSLALDELAAKINEVAAGTVADSGAVVQILASLSDIAPKFAPGLGLDKAFKQRGSVDAQSLLDDPQIASLAALAAELEAATRRLETERKTVDQALAPYRGHSQADALRACGVTDAAVALKADVAGLSFSGKADETQTVRVSGGVKPYVVRLRESPAQGVELRAPLPGDSNVEVRVPANTAAVERTLLILDRADPPHQLELPIKVAAGTESVPGAESLQLADNKSALIRKKLAALSLQAPLSIMAPSQNKYSVKTVAGPDNALVVALDCQKKAGVVSMDTRAALVGSLMRSAQLTVATTDENWAGIKFQGAEKCLAKP